MSAPINGRHAAEQMRALYHRDDATPRPTWRSESSNRTAWDALHRPQRPRNAREWATLRDRLQRQPERSR